MANLIIYHHDDLDGIASAAIIHQYFSDYRANDYSQAKFVEINYSTYVSFVDVIEPGDIVCFVDYSMGPNAANFCKLLARNSNEIVWIDHHKSSIVLINRIKTLPLEGGVRIGDIKNFDYLITDRFCATFLVYQWCVSKIKENNSGVVSDDAPMIVRYVDSWDRWTMVEPNTKEFHYGIDARELNPGEFLSVMMEVPKNIFNGYKDPSSYIEQMEYINHCIKEGKTIMQYIGHEGRRLRHRAGFNFTIVDDTKKSVRTTYNCFAMNDFCTSINFGEKYDSKDIVVAFHYRDGRWYYSFYSHHNKFTGLDCQEIACLLSNVYGNGGGGGHAGASGCTLNSLVLEPNCTVRLYKNIFGIMTARVKRPHHHKHH